MARYSAHSKGFRQQNSLYGVFCVGADTGDGERMIGCFTGGELLTSVSQWEGRERITTDTLWHYSYNLESRTDGKWR